MNQPVFLNLFLRQGYAYSKNWQWVDNGADVDLSGYTAQLTVKDVDANVLLSLSTTADQYGSGLTLDSSGNVTLTVKEETLANLTFSKARFKLDLIPPDAEPIPFIIGVAYLNHGWVS